MMTSHSHHAGNYDLFKGLGEEKTKTTIPTTATDSDDNDKKGSNGKWYTRTYLVCIWTNDWRKERKGKKRRKDETN